MRGEGFRLLFSQHYAQDNFRSSIAPKCVLRAMLLQAIYLIRSERQLMERLEFDLPFRRFVGLGPDEPTWDASTFSKNRDRLLKGYIAAKFLNAVLSHQRVKKLLSREHLSVDGTFIEAWSSTKSLRPKDTSSGDGTDVGCGGHNTAHDFHGGKRSKQTHASSTDPDAWLYRKCRAETAQHCYLGHVRFRLAPHQIPLATPAIIPAPSSRHFASVSGGKALRARIFSGV